MMFVRPLDNAHNGCFVWIRICCVFVFHLIWACISDTPATGLYRRSSLMPGRSARWVWTSCSAAVGRLPDEYQQANTHTRQLSPSVFASKSCLASSIHENILSILYLNYNRTGPHSSSFPLIRWSVSQIVKFNLKFSLRPVTFVPLCYCKATATSMFRLALVG